MVRRGAVFDLPTQGETFEILETPEETGDRYVARATFAPHARGPSAHRHPGLEERFEVVSGKMELRVGRQRRELTAGQTAVVSPGVVHDLWNPTDEPAVMVGEIVFTPLGLRPERTYSICSRLRRVWPETARSTPELTRLRTCFRRRSSPTPSEKGLRFQCL